MQQLPPEQQHGASPGASRGWDSAHEYRLGSDSEAARDLADLQRHVSQHGPAPSLFGTGCRWRESQAVAGGSPVDKRCVLQERRGAMFGGIESVWRCHAYEYWDSAPQRWAPEQPAACRIDAVALATWAADRATLRPGNGSISWGSAAKMSTWGLETWLHQQQQQQQQQQQWTSHSEAHQLGMQRGEHAHGTGRDALPDDAAKRAAAGAADSMPAPHQHSAQAHTWVRGDVASEVACAAHYCVLRNVWYNNGRFYFLRDAETPPLPGGTWQLGRNRANMVLSVLRAADWAASVDARVVPGETVILDYHFHLHPRALGHWQEMLLPLFSMLRHEPLVRRSPDRLLFLYQQRANVCDWVRGLLGVVLGVLPGQDLPPLFFQEEVAEPRDQVDQLLEGTGPSEWLMFEQVLWPRDVFHGGNRGCQDQTDAQLLRALAYALHGLPAPPIHPGKLHAPAPEQPGFGAEERAEPAPVAAPMPLPGPALLPMPGQQPAQTLRITLQRKSSNRRILNEGEVVAVLREFGEVRVVEFGADATFREQLEVMAGTDLFLSAHTSNLANALLLRPGAAVVEILQRNWAWEGIDRFFQSLTAQMGDIHHYALRCQGTNETAFLNPALHRLFANWTSQQCFTQECVEALTVVDVRVDTAALRALLADRLPLIRAGASVAEAALPWPSVPTGGPAPAQPEQQRPGGQGASPPVTQLAKRLFENGPRHITQRDEQE